MEYKHDGSNNSNILCFLKNEWKHEILRNLMCFSQKKVILAHRPRGTLARCCPGGRPGRRRWCPSQSWGCSESAGRVLGFGRAWTPTGRSVPCRSSEAPVTTWRRRCCWGGAPPQPAPPADRLLRKEVNSQRGRRPSLDSPARPAWSETHQFQCRRLKKSRRKAEEKRQKSQVRRTARWRFVIFFCRKKLLPALSLEASWLLGPSETFKAGCSQRTTHVPSFIFTQSPHLLIFQTWSREACCRLNAYLTPHVSFADFQSQNFGKVLSQLNDTGILKTEGNITNLVNLPEQSQLREFDYLQWAALKVTLSYR